MARLFVNDYFIRIEAKSNDADLLRLISSVSNIFTERKRDTYYCSLRKLPEVLHILKNINSEEQLSGQSRILYAEEMRRRMFTPLLLNNGPDMQSDWLWPHQCLGIELAQVNRRYAFFYDTRTGKTLMALKIMYDALKTGRAKRCLVVCPSAIIQAWLGDAAEHFPELKVVAYYSTTKQKASCTSLTITHSYMVYGTGCRLHRYIVYC